MTHYEYSPLNENRNEIRVLTLHPGDFSADIIVSIHKVRLTAKNPPVYEALSYVWGTTDNPVDIEVKSSGNDRLHQYGCRPPWRLSRRKRTPLQSGRLSITQNLAIALPYLRYKDKIRRLWIDAICINQQDLRERSSQVKRMGDIYRLAYRAVVWLGTESNNSAHVLKILSQLGSEIKIDYTSMTMSPVSSDSDPHWSNRGKKLPYSGHEVADMNALLRRPWFSRLWVWQEIRLARNTSILVCGSENIPWRTFRQAIFCLTQKHFDSTIGPGKVQLQLRASRVVGVSHSEIIDSFPGTILRMAHCKCSDPKDRIYAVLSMLDDSDKDIKIEPDYTQTTAQVYQYVALRHIEHRNFLDMLRYCELQNDTPSKMPTWVPNWDIPSTAKRLFSPNLASGYSRAKVQRKGARILSATGVISANVAKVEGMEFQIDPVSVVDVTRKLSPPNIERSAYVSRGSLFDAFISTVCANTFSHTYQQPRTDFPRFEETRKVVLAVLKDPGLVPKFLLGSDALKYLGSIHHYCNNRSFVTTEEGYIGLAPKATNSGDLVCVLLGCPQPLILRPTSGFQCQVVGECYVHGLMAGEALLGTLPDHYQAIQVFEDNGYYSGFVNTQTGKVQYSDPRMEEEDPVSNEGVQFECPDGSETPELTVDVLKRRGVNLQDFDLI